MGTPVWWWWGEGSVGGGKEVSSLLQSVGRWVLWVCAQGLTRAEDIFATLPISLILGTLILPFLGSPFS